MPIQQRANNAYKQYGSDNLLRMLSNPKCYVVRASSIEHLYAIVTNVIGNQMFP